MQHVKMVKFLQICVNAKPDVGKIISRSADITYSAWAVMPV